MESLNLDLYHHYILILGYIDPGSGSAIMSAIIGVVVAVGLAIKTYWYKIKSLFTGKNASKDQTQDSRNESKD